MSDVGDYFGQLEAALKCAKPVPGNVEPRWSDAFLDEVARRVAERLKNG